MTEHATVLFVGGGTGGHIFPNAAVLERLREQQPGAAGQFVLSRRPLDAQMAAGLDVPYTAISAEPFGVRPRAMWRFLRGFQQAKREAIKLIERSGARAMVATGGFVSGPAVKAAKAAGLPVALVNLDAVPGRANAWLAKQVDVVFSVYEPPSLPGARPIGLPLRRAVVRTDLTPAEARQQLSLEPGRATLFVTAGSQGAVSVNEAMMGLCDVPAVREALRERWQVLHLAGEKQRDAVAAAYAAAGVPSRVLAFCDQMGLAWRAATLAISRAGAGSVAEAWANGVPCIFLPYPHHKDEHQRLNAQPMADTGGAVVVRDHVVAAANVAELSPRLERLVTDDADLAAMRHALANLRRPDGAEAVADWVLEVLGA